MADFLKTYGTLIIAVMALVQYWFVALWRQYVRQGKIRIYETGRLEIGYGGFGPSIGVNGTLRCLQQDLFVRAIELQLVKEKHSSKHRFEWGVFRTQKLTLTGQQEATFELPHGFMLLTASPRRFNIQFHDMAVQSEIIEVISKVREKWLKILSELGREELTRLISEHASLPPQLRDPFLNAYEDFKNDEIHTSAFGALDRMCYWEPGGYWLEMSVRTSKPDKCFRMTWRFTLTEKDVEAVRLNVIKLLQDTCDRPSYGQYFFAYPEYEATQ